MKNVFFNVFSFLFFFIFIFSFVYADYNQTIFYEDFNDENLNETYLWKINNNAYYFIDGKLNSDGKKIDSTDRYLNQFDYFFNFSSANIEFSFDALLKSSGNPQKGRGVIFSIVGTNGNRYDLRIQNGYTSDFNINKQSLSLGYGTDSVYDYITTNFVPEHDKIYNLKAIRQNKTWFFYVDNVLIGQHQDTLDLTNFYQIHIPSVGSILIDNLKIVSLDSLYNENNTIINNTNQTINETQINNTEASIDDGLIRNSPVFYLHPDEYYEPREIYSILNNSDLKKENHIIKQKPISYNDIENLSSSYFLDLTNVDITDFNYPQISDFENFKPVIYGRAISYNNRKHYQYFIFYPFQKRNIMSHEGDWELIQVNENGAGKIESVEYFFDLWKLIYYDLNLITFINKTHPVVYVALGSHNNYANNDEIDFQNQYLYVQKYLSKIKGLEKISSEGKIYKPKILKNESIENNVIYYDINDINEIPLTFKGYYGELSELVLRQPPKGPNENPRFLRKWNEPENYAYNPELPFFSVFLYSPVNFEIFDENNILINETNENLLFLNEEPKTAIVKGTEFKLKLKAYDNGQFSMDLFLYDNETEKGLLVSFKNITTKDCSNGYLDANFESNFLLYYDSNCDHKYEIYLPTENTTMNYEYVLPDEDIDGISDFIDNCINNFNPDQSDFNKDNLGDECDNPIYYKKKALSLSEKENIKHKQKVSLSINYSLKDKYWEN
ncbi:MAG: hypothetical protein QXR96_02470, partial [Candidatus Woesearchaeota archaeon]